jgi:hypothetical protein
LNPTLESPPTKRPDDGVVRIASPAAPAVKGTTKSNHAAPPADLAAAIQGQGAGKHLIRNLSLGVIVLALGCGGWV